ncbi:centromere protein Chl4/mis15/CENP-N [Diplogelasinospora grovesii]|uniref:Centromere protein Chl4/mis15/CENP-N n=1 Tax=Diplogelasinospora grovesii TaxID=303347 RepID=A0AAN6NG50_9PEZI|nr:centromere protein Chl4/mis15/CENP-N [Diplogelasinospora grovesii]
MVRISTPTTARLPSSLLLDPSTTPAVSKTLSRLSRASLLSLALDWLSPNNLSLCTPYLHDPEREEEEDGEDEDDDFYPPAHSIADLQDLYSDLQTTKGSKREVLDRIVEGDWRHGVSLYQLAMADLQYLYDHPTSQKWSAYRILPLKPSQTTGSDEQEVEGEVDRESLIVPRFHPSTFLRNLQRQVLPDVKAHYNFDRHKTLPLLILRIFILDSPYNTNLSLSSGDSVGVAGGGGGGGGGSVVYIAFPDASPYIYLSKPTQSGGGGGGGVGGESKSLRNLMVEGIPKALSRPRQRFTLKSTNLVTRNLGELLEKRGAGRMNGAAGGWSIYAGEDGRRENPLDTVLPTPPLSEGDEEDRLAGEGGKDGEGDKRKRDRAQSPGTQRDERATKRRKLLAQARFGDTAKINGGRGVERVDIVVEDPFPLTTLTRKRRAGGDDGERGGREGDGEREGEGQRKGARKSAVEMILEKESADDEDHDPLRDQSGGKDPGGGGGGGGGRWRPSIRLTFHGPHVFAGIRQLVEHGIIDGERMPGWMTGEEGVTIGAVRNGRIRGHKGSGI